MVMRINNNPRNQESTSQVSYLSFLTHLSGYGGYVPNVKSENVFGQTYGKTSYQSNSKNIVKGLDQPSHLRFNTSMKSEFVDHSKRTDKIETTAEIVGVDRGDTCFKKVSIYFCN